MYQYVTFHACYTTNQTCTQKLKTYYANEIITQHKKQSRAGFVYNASRDVRNVQGPLVLEINTNNYSGMTVF